MQLNFLVLKKLKTSNTITINEKSLDVCPPIYTIYFDYTLKMSRIQHMIYIIILW